jgi:excisionase family DNA binding protein
MMKTECAYFPGPTSQPALNKISFTPNEAAAATGRSRSRIFKAIKDEELTAKKDGRATVIEADELRRWIREFPVAKAAA